MFASPVRKAAEPSSDRAGLLRESPGARTAEQVRQTRFASSLRWKFADVPVAAPASAGAANAPAARRPSPAVQLSIEPAGSPAERQAEAAAAQVTRSGGPARTDGAPARFVGPGALALARPQRRRPGLQTARDPSFVPALVHQLLGSSSSPLDQEARAYFEPRFGQDLGGVRMHTGESAARSARAVGALAYAAGEHIVLGAGYAPGSNAGRQLLAHELAHVLQQRQDPAPAATIARAPDKHQQGSSRSESLSDLHDILVKLLKSLDRKTQLSILGFKTIALGLVEGKDETGSAFQTLVYTASGNWASVDLEAKAAALGITSWNVRARAEEPRKKEAEEPGESAGSDANKKVRGPEGAPEDAEQLLIEGQDQADMTLLGMAVSRKPCFDCTDALIDAAVETVFVDPAKHLPKRQRARKVKPSAAFNQAKAAIEAVFSPQISAPGETRDDLGPKAEIWSALNGLDIKELYRVLEETPAARRAILAPKAVKAEGIGEQRILGVLDVLALKAENFKQQPDGLKQAIVGNLVQARLALIPQDQSAYLIQQLYPSLRLAAKPKTDAPKRSQPKKQTEGPSGKKDSAKDAKDAQPTNSYVGALVKALAALGVAAAAIEAAGDFLALVASDLFTNVVLRGIVNQLQAPVRQAIKESVEETIKHAGPKARVLTEEVLHKLPEKAAEELGDVVEKITHAYAR